jgi:hypothetical protein
MNRNFSKNEIFNKLETFVEHKDDRSFDHGDRHRKVILKTSRTKFCARSINCRGFRKYQFGVGIVFFIVYIWLTSRGTPLLHDPNGLGELDKRKDETVFETLKGTEIGRLEKVEVKRKWKKMVNEQEGSSFQSLIKESNQNHFSQRKRLVGTSGDQEFRSTFQCLGKQNDIEAISRRPCRFHRVCFSKDSEMPFYYLPFKEPVFYDAVRGPLYDFQQPGSNGFIQVNSLWYGYVSRITPIVKYTRPENPVWVNETTVIWSSWSYEYNLGHFLYEELASAYFALVRFGILDFEKKGALKDRDFTLLDMRYSLDNNRYQSFLSFFSGAVSKNPVKGLRNYIDSALKDKPDGQVCFQDLVVASATRAFLSPRDEYQFGREPIWFRFRKDLLDFNQVDSSFVPSQHLLLFIQKEGSMYKTGDDRKHFRDIVNFNDMVNHVKSRFTDLTVKVINPARLSIKQQMELMVKTTIVITPPGKVFSILI